jgi:hypothetical protein
MTSAQPRPRVVDVAFWAWTASAVMLIVLGILLITAPVPFAFFRGSGIIWSIAGLGIAYLATQMRRGDSRFRRAAIWMAMTLTVLLVLFTLLIHGILWALVGIPLMIGAYAASRPNADEWFDAVESGAGDG